MRLSALFIAACLLAGGAVAQTAPTPPTAKPAEKPAPGRTFAEVGAAQKACGAEKTVWFNPASGIFFANGNRYFGKTKQGAYSCEADATAAGYRAAQNKQ